MTQLIELNVSWKSTSDIQIATDAGGNTDKPRGD